MIGGKELMFTFICLNLAVFMLNGVGILGIQGYPQGFFLPSDIGSLFSIENWNLATATLAVVGGVGIGLIALLTGHALIGVGAIILWALSIIFRPIGLVVTGFPMFLGSMAGMIGADATIVAMISSMVTAIVVFVMFFFFLEIATSRQFE